MKIQSIRTKLYQWQGPVKTSDTIFATPLSALPFQNDAQAPFRFFSWLVVEIETDEGHVGYGNAGLCPDLTKQIIDTKLCSLLLDENPLNTEYLYEKMYRSTVAFGRKGAVLAAISAELRAQIVYGNEQDVRLAGLRLDWRGRCPAQGDGANQQPANETDNEVHLLSM